jgi:hypothetical protein
MIRGSSRSAHLNEPAGTAAAGGLLIVRACGCHTIALKTGVPDGYDKPSSLGHPLTTRKIRRGDLVALGVPNLVNEVVNACGLAKEAIAWIGEDEASHSEHSIARVCWPRSAEGGRLGPPN